VVRVVCFREDELTRNLEDVELFAWLGLDEFGSGKIGLKQGVVPAGLIPIVSIEQEKVDKYWDQAEEQARECGKRIYLCRFKLVEIVRQTERGDDCGQEKG